MTDWSDEPSAKVWMRHVLDDMVPKMADSQVIVSLCPMAGEHDEGDVKWWVELGASVMMNKPILLVVFDDREIPPKLAAIADEVVHLPGGVDPANSQALAAAIKRMLT